MFIPNDFPHEAASFDGARSNGRYASLANGQSKLHQGQQHRLERYQYCRQLADRVIVKAPEKHATDYEQYTHAQLLAGILAWLEAENYGTSAEMRWVIREAGRSLNWPLPEVAFDEHKLRAG